MTQFWMILHQPLAELAPWGVILFVSILFGCCLGSFLNVCIWRIPLGESVVVVSSHCPKCQHPIAWFDNIPIFSYLVLRGKCRNCHQPITPRYWIVEAMTGVLFTLLTLQALRWGAPVWVLIQNILVLTVIVSCAFIDVEKHLLPNRLTVFGIISGIVMAGVFPEAMGVTRVGPAFGLSVASSLGIMLFLELFVLATRRCFSGRALGGGDIKYAGFLGATFSWYGAIWILLGASLLALAVALVKLPWSKSKERFSTAQIPFGLYLGIAGYLFLIGLGELREFCVALGVKLP